MALYAEVDDVAARYENELPTARREWVATLLDDAETVLYAEIPGLDARVESGRVSEATVRRVECSMVLSVLRNPSGFSSQTAGEFSYSFQGGGSPGGRLVLSAADRRALLGGKRATTVPMADSALRHPLRRPVIRPAPIPAERPDPQEP